MLNRNSIHWLLYKLNWSVFALHQYSLNFQHGDMKCRCGCFASISLSSFSINKRYQILLCGWARILAYVQQLSHFTYCPFLNCLTFIYFINAQISRRLPFPSCIVSYNSINFLFLIGNHSILSIGPFTSSDILAYIWTVQS